MKTTQKTEKPTMTFTAMPLTVGIALAKEVENNANTSRQLYKEIAAMEPRVAKVEKNVTELSKTQGSSSKKLESLSGRVDEVESIANMHRIVKAEETLYRLENKMKDTIGMCYNLQRENAVLRNSLLRMTLNENSNTYSHLVQLSSDKIEKIRTAQRIAMCDSATYKMCVNMRIRAIASETDLTVGAVWRNSFIALAQVAPEDEECYNLDTITRDVHNKDLRFLYMLTLLGAQLAEVKNIQKFLSCLSY